jgi:hypothetical protein
MGTPMATGTSAMLSQSWGAAQGSGLGPPVAFASGGI